MKKKIILLFIMIFTLLFCVSIGKNPTVNATDDNNPLTWDGVSVDTELPGSGKYYDPYRIETAAHLAGFSANVNSGILYDDCYIHLTADIDMMNHPFTPIGNMDNCFSGSFYGNLYTISNVNINTVDPYLGFFGVLSSGTLSGTIRDLNLYANITVESNEISSSMAIGLLTGLVLGNATIDNCYVDGTITVNMLHSVSSTVGTVSIGGITGANYGIIINSHANAGISGTVEKVTDENSGTPLQANVGGLVGLCGGYIYNCISVVKGLTLTMGVVGDQNYINANAGGLVGTKILYNIENSFSNIQVIGASDEVKVPFNITLDTSKTYPFSDTSSNNNIYVGTMIGSISSSEINYIYSTWYDDTITDPNVIIPDAADPLIGDVALNMSPGVCEAVLYISDEYIVNNGFLGVGTELSANLNAFCTSIYRTWVLDENFCPKISRTLEHFHDYTLSLIGDEITLSCSANDSTYTAYILLDEKNLVFDFTEKAPVEIMNTDPWSEDFPIEITYTNNLHAGQATATIGYGTKTVDYNFTIEKQTLDQGLFTVSDSDYTGSEIKNVSVSPLSGLKEDTHYTVAYTDNINAGTATAEITGIGDFEGSFTLTYEILTIDLDQKMFTVPTTVNYTGSPVEAVVVNSQSGLTTDDYDITYTNNIQLGNAEAAITGKGNYKGSFILTYEITPGILDQSKFSVPKTINYTGSAIEAVLIGSDSGYTIDDYTIAYSNNINVGTAEAVITGIGNYNNTFTLTYDIVAIDLNQSMFIVPTSVDFMGIAIEAVEVLADSGYTNDDYNIVYSNNINAGTAKAEITGIGNYKGSFTLTYEILPLNLDQTMFSVPNSVYYTGTAIEAVEMSAASDYATTDYNIVYSDNINVGTAKALVTGIGNYKGSFTLTYEILAINLEQELFIVPTSLDYTGTAIEAVEVLADLGYTTDDYTIVYSDNINVGTAKALVTGIGNYKGSFTLTYEILAINLEQELFIVPTSIDYTGSAIEAVEVLADLGYTSDDYTIVYSDNINVGTAKALVTGIGNYKGSFTLTYEILAINLNQEMFSVEASLDYTGSAIEAVEVLAYSDYTTDDYTIVYSNNINAGTAKALVTGIGNYKGSFTLTYEILPINLDQEMFSVEASLDYTGKAIEALTVKNYLKDIDFTVLYTNNINAGTAEAEITGIGNYKGTFTLTYEILPINLNQEMFSVATTVDFTGEAIEAVAVNSNANYLKDIDFTVFYTNNINVGTAEALIAGIGNYKGSFKLTYSIVPINLDQAMFSVPASVDYTGLAIEAVIKNQNSVYQLNSDYTISYINNINVGTAEALITGIGNYKESFTLTYQILPIALDQTMFSVPTSINYTGTNQEEVEVDPNSIYVINSDYTISYSNNINAGTAEAIITGIGNYKESFTLTYQILPIDLDQTMFSVPLSLNYTGSAIEAVIIDENSIYKVNTDYTTTYSNNINVGTASVLITGVGNYKGSFTLTYQILPIDLDQAMFSVDANLDYTGSPIEALKVNPNATYAKDIDYTVAYSNNINTGLALALITGVGNYKGSFTLTFNIVAISLDKTLFSTVSSAEYTASALQPDVTCSDASLKQNVDYNIAYSNNISVGEASITITGIGNYKDSFVLNFSIVHTIHQYTERYEYNDTHHWQVCTICSLLTPEDAHTGDEHCDICGYTPDKLEVRNELDQANKLVDSILNGEVDDPTLQEAINEVPESVVKEVTEKTSDELKEIAELLENGELSPEEAQKRIDIATQIANSTIIMSNNMRKSINRLSNRDQTAIIPVTDYAQGFYDKQYEELLKYDYNITPDVYTEVVEFAETVVSNMEEASLTIRKCDGEAITSHIGSYIENLSVKTFRNYNKEQADREFVQLAYDAILLHLQQQTLFALEDTYQNSLDSGKYQGASLTQLEEVYLGEKAKILDINVFEEIVLSVLQKQYITLIKNKAEEGVYSLEEANDLIASANNLDEFRVTYQKIFESWALNLDNYELSLEELTNTVVEDFGTSQIKIDVNNKLTTPEILIIFGLVLGLGVVICLRLLMKGRGDYDRY